MLTNICQSKNKITLFSLLLDGFKQMINYKNNQVNIGAEGEIILCGGAIGSPQLLLLSGVGPKRQFTLRRRSILYLV